MPEQLTKHPEVTLQVLRSTGARCGEGLPQEILKTCPPARFCKTPGGELCVYGLPEAMQMTQVTQAEWRGLIPQALLVQPATVAASSALVSGVAGVVTGALLVAIGLWVWRRK